MQCGKEDTMRRRRPTRPTRDAPEREPEEEAAAEVAWDYLVEEGEVASDRLGRRCNELGAQGWELVSAIPLSRQAFSSGGRTTGTLLFFKRRLP
jgi:hypothetical protein